jgi:hypothetical protein
MALRDDYILRFLNLLREALAEALKLRQAGKYEHALIVLIQAQEKLFVRPAAEFIGLSLEDQVALLRRGESKSDARTKLLSYATLLREAGLVYQERDRPELAASAFQLALQVTLHVALEDESPDEAVQDSLQELLARVPADQLQPPVAEMLKKLPRNS